MTTPSAPTFPFSMFDPVHLGIDENGEHVYVNLAERNMLLGGEPGAGKSSGINLIVAHGALSHDCKLILIDGKQVELGPVHSRRMRGKTILPCRPRRDAHARRCPHGHDISCPARLRRDMDR